MKNLILLLAIYFPTLLEAQPVVEVTQDITTSMVWNCDTVYHLTKGIRVRSGAVLTIEPGTKIKASRYAGLLIVRGAKIIADGKPGRPIIFTHDSTNLELPSWLGLLVLGAAPENCATDSFYHCSIDFAQPIDSSGYYGGNNPEDNSGILRYVIIENAGGTYQPTDPPSAFRSLGLGGVGRGTIIEYVHITSSFSRGIQLVGGTVNLSHLKMSYNSYDDLSIMNGYTGNIQFACIVRKADHADYFVKPIHSQNNDAGNLNQPITNAAISNITLLLPQDASDDTLRQAVFFRRQSNSSLYNSVIAGYFPSGLRLFVNGPESEMRRVFMGGVAAPGFDQPATSWFNTTGWNNHFYTNANALGLQNWQSENMLLQPGSILMNAADFSDTPRLADPFFEKVSYAGAFGLDDWTDGWLGNNPSAVCGFSQAVSPKSEPGWQISPNPAKECFRIISPDPLPTNYELFDFYGKMVRAGIISEQNIVIGQNGLPPGLFFLKIFDKRGNSKAFKVLLN